MNRLINNLAKFPGLGRKSATRIAYFLLRTDLSFVRSLAKDMVSLRDQIHPCNTCGYYTESDICVVCLDPNRDSSLICVVEQSQDIESIESTGDFKGRYHVLMGVLSPLDGIGPEDLQISSLIKRIKNDDIREIIVATNPTVEGEATAALLAEKMKELGVKTYQLAHGFPIGSDIEYSDRLTISSALRGKTRIS